MEEAFEEVLNVQNTLEEGAKAELEDHLHIDTPEVTREEVERAVKKLQNGVRQGCVLSPILFNFFMDRILKEVAGTLGRGLQVEYTTAGGSFLTYCD